jgi:hypothetical protein
MNGRANRIPRWSYGVEKLLVEPGANSDVLLRVALGILHRSNQSRSESERQQFHLPGQDLHRRVASDVQFLIQFAVKDSRF